MQNSDRQEKLKLLWKNAKDNAGPCDFEVLDTIEYYTLYSFQKAVVSTYLEFVVLVMDERDQSVQMSFEHKISHQMTLMKSSYYDVIAREKERAIERAKEWIFKKLLDEEVDDIILKE